MGKTWKEDKTGKFRKEREERERRKNKNKGGKKLTPVNAPDISFEN
jgi:hypothetical protein